MLAIGTQQRETDVTTYSRLTYHVVFSTKYRVKSIREQIREPLYRFIGGIIRNRAGHLIEIGGVEDHLHVLANFAPASSVSGMVRDIKAHSARWTNGLPEIEKRLEWQRGYGAFTVSHSKIASVRTYILNQREHHRKQTVEQEFIELLKRHHIEFDTRYLFEAEHQG